MRVVRQKRLLIFLAALALSSAIALWAWRRDPASIPPSVDLKGADPEVAHAIESARALVLATPHSGSAWGKLGMLYAVHDFDDPAKACFMKAEQLDPADMRWPYLHGMMLRASSPQEALPLLRRAAEHAENDSTARLLLAETLLDENHPDEAEPYLRGVSDADPLRPRACLGLARLALKCNDPVAALALLREAVDLATAAKPIHTLLAEVHHRLGAEKDAREELRLLAKLPEEFSWPDPVMEQMWQLRAGVQAHVSYAGYCLQQGRHAEAADVLRRTVHEHAESYDAWLALGRILVQTRHYEEAVEALRKAINLRPNAFEPHFYLGTALHQQGDRRAAAEQYRQALHYKPGHALAHYNLGICYRELDDLEQAISALREAARCKPELATAHRELGVLLAKTSQDAEALTQLQAALCLAPGDEPAAKLLEELEKRQRQPR
jgi:Flp pilus assembly protein TadD